MNRKLCPSTNGAIQNSNSIYFLVFFHFEVTIEWLLINRFANLKLICLVIPKQGNLITALANTYAILVTRPAKILGHDLEALSAEQ